MDEHIIPRMFCKNYLMNDIIYCIGHNMDFEPMCLNVGSFSEFNVFCKSANKMTNISNVKYVRFCNLWKFEDVVKVLSRFEDSYDVELSGIDISLNTNHYALFYELIDFYGYDLPVNIISDNSLTPFQIIDDVFTSPDIPSFCKHGISLDLVNLNYSLWLNEAIFKTTQKYIFSVFNLDNRRYYTR